MSQQLLTDDGIIEIILFELSKGISPEIVNSKQEKS